MNTRTLAAASAACLLLAACSPTGGGLPPPLRTPIGTSEVAPLLPTPIGAGGVTPIATPIGTGGVTPPAPTPIGTGEVAPPLPKSERLLIISVDGLRPDALSESLAPNIMGLAGRGAYTWRARTVLPSVTLPSHASMLSGVSVERHGITWNDLLLERGHILVPTVFSLAHDAGLRTEMIFGKGKLITLAAPGAVDEALDLSGHGDADIGAAAAQVVARGFDLLFVHLPGVDFAGHTFGWMSAGYLSAVASADRAVGRIVSAVEAAGMAETTTVILTADHGGNGFIHGRNIPEDTTIPWVIAGPGVLADHELMREIHTMDTAATALFALGLDAPAEWDGQPVMEAFGADGAGQVHGGTWEQRASMPTGCGAYGESVPLRRSTAIRLGADRDGLGLRP